MHVQGWEPHEHKSTVAVTAGNKAFVWWRVTGVYKDDWCSPPPLPSTGFPCSCLQVMRPWRCVIMFCDIIDAFKSGRRSVSTLGAHAKVLVRFLGGS